MTELQFTTNPKIKYFMQDTFHITVKLRNRLLNMNKSMYIGKFIVNLNHLRILICKYPKSLHGLCRTDISNDDR